MDYQAGKHHVRALLMEGRARIVPPAEAVRSRGPWRYGKSDVWTRFGSVQMCDTGLPYPGVVACRLCYKVYSYKGSSQGTSTLRLHNCLAQDVEGVASLQAAAPGVGVGVDHVSVMHIPQAVIMDQPAYTLPDYQAPKEGLSHGEAVWPLQQGGASSSSAPGPSRALSGAKQDRASTSAYLKPEPGITPPPPPYESGSLGPRLLPRPSPSAPSSSSSGGPGPSHAHPSPVAPQVAHPRLRVRPPPSAASSAGSSVTTAPQHVLLPPPPHQEMHQEAQEEPQQVCLRWNSFSLNMEKSFPALLLQEKFVDVTLACEGRSIKCHKVVLSSCSRYLEQLLSDTPCQHPIVLMPRDLRFWQLRALVDFMYRGEVNVEHEQLGELLAAAEMLQVKGLAGPAASSAPGEQEDLGGAEGEDLEERTTQSPRLKRRRMSSPPPLAPTSSRPSAPSRPAPSSTPVLPSSSAVSITRLGPASRLRGPASVVLQSAAAPQPAPGPSGVSTREPRGVTAQQQRVHSPGIEITPLVSFEEIKQEPIDISDSNEDEEEGESPEQDYDMEKDYEDAESSPAPPEGPEAPEDRGEGEGDSPSPTPDPSNTERDSPDKEQQQEEEEGEEMPATENGPVLSAPDFGGSSAGDYEGAEEEEGEGEEEGPDLREGFPELGLTTEMDEDPSEDPQPGPSSAEDA